MTPLIPEKPDFNKKEPKREPPSRVVGYCRCGKLKRSCGCHLVRKTGAKK